MGDGQLQGPYLHTGGGGNTHTHTHTTTMLEVGFEPTIIVSKQVKTVHVSDHSATMIGPYLLQIAKYMNKSFS
jgi:hypothetical protein